MATKKKTLKKPTRATGQPTTVAQPRKPTTAAQPGTGQPVGQPDPNALSIGDLKNLSSILDVASTRGAFKAAEMAGVGFLYNKLQAFLSKVTPPEDKKIGEGAKETAPIGGVAKETAPTTINTGGK